MEKGRTIGSYFLFLIREGVFRLKRELWGWRGFAALFIVFYLVIDLFGAMESDRSTMGQGMAVIWMVLLFPPRMGKLLYLLPFSKKERCHYLLMYLFTYLVFQIFVYLLIGAGACLISGYSYFEWLKFFWFATMPFLVMYSGITVYTVAVQKEPKNSYSWVTPFYCAEEAFPDMDQRFGMVKEKHSEKKLQKKKYSEFTEAERETRKKELWLSIITAIGVIVAAFQVYICPVFLMGVWSNSLWFWVGAVISYICAVVVVGTYWNRAWEQINKKGSTGKEESVCSL